LQKKIYKKPELTELEYVSKKEANFAIFRRGKAKSPAAAMGIAWQWHSLSAEMRRTPESASISPKEGTEKSHPGGGADHRVSA
jgi:hypothetical protein